MDSEKPKQVETSEDAEPAVGSEHPVDRGELSDRELQDVAGGLGPVTWPTPGPGGEP
jgi:hypothetical protein